MQKLISISSSDRGHSASDWKNRRGAKAIENSTKHSVASILDRIYDCMDAGNDKPIYGYQ